MKIHFPADTVGKAQGVARGRDDATQAWEADAGRKPGASRSSNAANKATDMAGLQRAGVIQGSNMLAQAL